MKLAVTGLLDHAVPKAGPLSTSTLPRKLLASVPRLTEAPRVACTFSPAPAVTKMMGAAPPPTAGDCLTASAASEICTSSERLLRMSGPGAVGVAGADDTSSSVPPLIVTALSSVMTPPSTRPPLATVMVPKTRSRSSLPLRPLDSAKRSRVLTATLAPQMLPSLTALMLVALKATAAPPGTVTGPRSNKSPLAVRLPDRATGPSASIDNTVSAPPSVNRPAAATVTALPSGRFSLPAVRSSPLVTRVRPL